MVFADRTILKVEDSQEERSCRVKLFLMGTKHFNREGEAPAEPNTVRQGAPSSRLENLC